MNEENLTPEQRYRIEQVEATMRLSGFEITPEAHQNLVDMELRRKTTEQVVEEITKRYAEDNEE